ncbi:hypothetical protein N7463_001152 [Penicillium fimorum]|uniref:Uncharacterized protein n=1 Tax=Penicillium fimorum TaxID=1882269 RepID=A0A9W9Y5T0_9EURO|nr:hypothetical protein N7463_001152 [Penicillium fimorum]
MVCFGYGGVIFALTGASLFSKLYEFNTAETGLILSIPLLIGGGAGELSGGWVTDWLSNRHAKKHNGERLPEARLNAIWGALLIPIGLTIEGICLSHSKTASWVGSAMGILPLGERIGFQFAWLTFSLIVVVLMIPVVLLRVYGARWRKLRSQTPLDMKE